MPKVFSVHGFSNFDHYEYTEGLFYTLGVIPKEVEQKRAVSSGFNVGIFKNVEDIKNAMKNHITQLLLGDNCDYVSINTYQAQEDDYYFCFSGPGNLTNKYIILDNDITCIEGNDVFEAKNRDIDVIYK